MILQLFLKVLLPLSSSKKSTHPAHRGTPSPISGF
jgi:hypothetical protein